MIHRKIGMSKKSTKIHFFTRQLVHVSLLFPNNLIKGILIEADEGEIRVENRNGTTDINMNEIFFIEVLNMKEA